MGVFKINWVVKDSRFRKKICSIMPEVFAIEFYSKSDHMFELLEILPSKFGKRDTYMALNIYITSRYRCLGRFATEHSIKKVARRT